MNVSLVLVGEHQTHIHDRPTADVRGWWHSAAVAKPYEAALTAILTNQQQVIARGQALACGMTPAMLRRRTAVEGRWQRVLPGVYLAVTGTPTLVQREMAALAYAGKDSVITGAAALPHHRIRAPAAELITVLIPARRAVRSTGFVRVWRTARMPEMFLNDRGVRVALPARAVADTARALTGLREVRAVVGGAVQSGHCPVFLLADEVAAGPRRDSALLRQAIAEVAEGIRSVVEGEFRDLLIRARLPQPLFNARILAGRGFVAMADAWWPDAGVAAEVDSREWHLSPADWERTLRRHAAMTAHGILVLHFTPRMIRGEPGRVVAEVRAAIKAGRARPALALRTVPVAA
jgi:very-short-patch-repair endonuclease